MKWLLLVCCGCSPSSVTRLYGEVHVHEFPSGVHPAALFVAPPLPASRASGESIFVVDAPPLGSCAAGLGADPPPTIQAVDAGRLVIQGGVSPVELRFDAGVRSYLPTQTLGTQLFHGGENLRVTAAGAEAPGFSGVLRAPLPLELQSPATLDALDGDLTVRWTPSTATRISLILVGSRSDGQWASISCAAADSDGEITLPSSLLLTLPPAPRDLQLQVSRDEIVRMESSRDGDGVVLHAAYQLNLDGNQP